MKTKTDFGKVLRTLAGQVKEFKRDSYLTPAFMILEVVVETLIPLLMARIVDEGIGKGNMQTILLTGLMMVGLALAGLFTGAAGGYFGAQASTGFARNLRKAMFENIQTFSFSNIDKFSTSGLVTRLTTDVTNLQNAYQMLLRMFVRAPFSMIVAMVMAFIINARIASVYLVAVIALAIFLGFVMVRATRYFRMVFEKYDALNESVQENVTGIRVVKAYVREEYEGNKFATAAANIYNLFVKAEYNIIINMPVMQGTVYVVILIISWLGINNTYAALVLPAWSFGMGLYLMKQFMEQLPDSLMESARLQGANEWQIFWRIVMPNVKPAWLTLAIFQFQQMWANTGSMFLRSEELKPLQYALQQIAAGGTARAGASAAVTFIIAAVPIIFFLLCQSNVLETMTTSGMKE